METLLDHLATYQVPHAYFTHFYIVSVVSSVFWGVQLLAQGAAVKALASYSSSTRPEESMSTGQVFLAWSLMAVQGLRRLYESVTLAKPSSAKMWFVHWLIGIGFYLAVGVAVWMEGVGTCYREAFASNPQSTGGTGEIERTIRHYKRISDPLANFGVHTHGVC